MGNASRKTSYPKATSSVGSASKKARWGVGLGVPSPPGKPLLIPGEEDSDPDTVGIRWERSPSNGGTAIIGYIVEHRKMGSPNWVRSAPFLCNFPELILSGLDPGWRYQFRVKAQNAVGLSDPSEISDPLTVTLQRSAASPPRFEIELKDTVALENDQVEFSVSFTGSPIPKISWFKDGFEIFSSRRTKIITENGRSNLLIHRIALDDEGEIKCTATNRVGHASTKAKLSLEAPPRIRLPRQYEDGLLFEQDETIRLKVSLAGRPPPSVIWYHDGEMVAPDSRHIFDAIDGESTMKIPDAKRQDRGEYTVRATNKLGEDISSFLVTVTDRPAAPGRPVVTMTLGRSVTLSWKEPDDDGGCKIGTYIVEYYRIGWNIWLKATTCRQTSATLSELIEGSEYRFRVKAENPYGLSDPSDESDIIFIPDLKRGILAADMREKSQSHREIYRGRSEKREVSFVETSKRTRSLTREESATNKKTRDHSSERLKSSRTDSRVTFALDTMSSKEATDNNNVILNHNQMKEKELTNTIKTEVKTHNLGDDSMKTVNMKSTSDNSPKHIISSIKIQDPAAFNITPTHLQSPLLKHSFDMSEESPKKLSVQTFAENRSKSADDAGAIDQTECNDSTLHGSSEFMLVLYPEEAKETHIGERKEKKADGDFRKEYHPKPTESDDGDEDLIPPPMSFSLPELFSANHEIVEIFREAVSSTELLHERAMERFYRAVAAEKAANEAKDKVIASNKTEDKSNIDTIGLFDVKVRPLRRRLSNSGAQAISWQMKRDRRRSSDSHSDSNRTSLKLPSFGALEDASSDPTLSSSKIVEKLEEYDESMTRKLSRWPNSEMNFQNKEVTSKDDNKETSSKVKQLDENVVGVSNKILISVRPPDFEESTYHPWSQGRLFTQSEKSASIPSHESEMIKTSEANKDINRETSTPVVPKSILKKRVEPERVVLNQFGRPIPPEVPLEKVSDQKVIVEPLLHLEPLDTSTTKDYNLLSELEKDNATVMSAAEAAKDRRKSRLAPSSSVDSRHEEEQADERMAVVSHYTEIVKEYSMTHTPFPPRPYSRQSTPTLPASPPNIPQPIPNEQQKAIIVNQPIVSDTIKYRSPTKTSEQLRSRNLQHPLERTRSPPPLRTSINVPAEIAPTVLRHQMTHAEPQTEDSTLPRSENLSSRSRNALRDKEPSSRSSSKSRRSTKSPSRATSQVRSKRSPSRARSSSRTRSDSKKESSRDNAQVRTERKPSRPTSRSSSRDRSRAETPISGKIERLQRTLENKQLASRKSFSHTTVEYENVTEHNHAVGRHIKQAETDVIVRKTMSYVTDISLLLAAIYVYIFKREIFALPFIVLLLYRHIQNELKNLLPKWMFPNRKT